MTEGKTIRLPQRRTPREAAKACALDECRAIRRAASSLPFFAGQVGLDLSAEVEAIEEQIEKMRRKIHRAWKDESE